MKHIIIIILLICLSLQVYAQKLLPVMMESSDNSTKLEMTYDHNRRLTHLKSTIRSPFDSTNVYINITQIAYPRDSTIKIDGQNYWNGHETGVHSCTISYNNKEIQVLGNENRFISLSLDENKNVIKRTEKENVNTIQFTLDGNGSLIKHDIITSDKIQTYHKYQYNQVNQLTEIVSLWIDNNGSKEMTTEFDYPERNNKNAVFSDVNIPEWLLVYLFNQIYGYLYNAKGIKSSIVNKLYGEIEGEGLNEQSNISYTYNPSGYPISVLSEDNPSVMNITYTAIK